MDIIGPRLHRKWAHPYDCQVIGAVTAPDFPMSLHICGDSTMILPEMLATGAPILELDYKTDMRKAKELMRGQGHVPRARQPGADLGRRSRPMRWTRPRAKRSRSSALGAS